MAKKNSMPRVLKIGKLDIRHNTPRSHDDLTWLQVTNFYWGERFLGAIVPGAVNIPLQPRGVISIRFRDNPKGFLFCGGIPSKCFSLREWRQAWQHYRKLKAAKN